MFPYQIYKVLTDQRLSDLREEARRHELAAAARNASRSTAEPSRLKDAAGRIVALLHARDSARERSAPVAGPGPIGCAT